MREGIKSAWAGNQKARQDMRDAAVDVYKYNLGLGHLAARGSRVGDKHSAKAL